MNSRVLVAFGAVIAIGCSAHAAGPRELDAASNVDAASADALTPQAVAVITRLLRLPLMLQQTVRGTPKEYYGNLESTATDEQLGDARALALECARQVAQVRRGRETQRERPIEIAGLPWPYPSSWTPDYAQRRCEQLASEIGDAIERRAQHIKSTATLIRWLKDTRGDRGDLVRRYGLPERAETDAGLEDRFWIYRRRVNNSQLCTVTYYFQNDQIERTDAEPATCFASQTR